MTELPAEVAPIAAEAERLRAHEWLAYLPPILCATAALIPLWSVKYPPMVDLPQHAAQIYLWEHIRDPAIAARYHLNWFTPYLLGYGLTRALHAWVSIRVALKLVVSAAILGVPGSLWVLLRETEADPWWALTGFVVAYGYSFYWGFLNFLVAVPIGFLFLAALLRYSRAPTARRGTLLGLFAIALFFAHVLVLGFAGLAGLFLLAGSSRSVRDFARRVWPLLLPIPAVVAWLLLTRANAPMVRSLTLWRFAPLDRLGALPGALLADEPLSQGTAAIGLLALLLGVAARPVRSWARWGAASAILAVYLFGPFRAFGTYLLYPRFALLVVPLLLIALAPSPVPERRRLARAGVVLVVLGWSAVLGFRFAGFNFEAAGFDEVERAIPPGSSLLSVSFILKSDFVPEVPFTHFAAWHQASRGGQLGYSFAELFPELVQFNPGMKPRMSPGLEEHPERFLWQRDGGYDYYLLHTRQDLGAGLARRAGKPLPLVAHRGNWWLYQNPPPHEAP